MFSNSLAAAPLSVMSQHRVRAGVSPPQRWPRAVLVCIGRFSAWLMAAANMPCLGCVGSSALYSFWHDRQTFSSVCTYARRVAFCASSVHTALYALHRL